MSLNFIENDLKLDASGINIGGSGTITTTLTLDQRNTIPATFTVTVPNNVDDDSIPYTATLVKGTDNQTCTLTITFSQPAANVRFGTTRTLTVSSSSGDFSLNVEINYTNAYIANNWTNATASTTLDNFSNKANLTSSPLNTKLLALLQSATNSLNQVKNYIKYYSFREKYLSDIIDFAIASGSSMEATTGTITSNSDNNIISIVKDYEVGRNRTERIKIEYTYGNYSIIRLRKRDSTYTELETTTMSLLDSFIVKAIDGSNNTIYKLGTVTITRSVTPTIYSNPYLLDYDDSLPLETIDTDPDNILSDYKYYKTNVITGWTVV